MEQKGQEELGSGEGGGREGMVNTPSFKRGCAPVAVLRKTVDRRCSISSSGNGV